MRNALSLLFFRLAGALHGKCKEADLYSYATVYTPDGKLTTRFSGRTCRICGASEEFPWNRNQWGWVCRLQDGEFCELCGATEELKVIPLGSVARMTTTCRICRERAMAA